MRFLLKPYGLSLRQANEDLVVIDFDRVCGQVFLCRATYDFSGWDVEPCVVFGAFDDIALYQTIRQRGLFVTA